MRLNSLLAERTVQLDRRFVESQLDHRDIGSGLVQKIPQLQGGDVEFGVLEMIERFAEMNQHEIGFVSQHGKQRALAGDVVLHLLQSRARLAEDLALRRALELPPVGPAETEHLVENARAFQGQRYGVQSAGGQTDFSI